MKIMIKKENIHNNSIILILGLSLMEVLNYAFELNIPLMSQFSLPLITLFLMIMLIIEVIRNGPIELFSFAKIIASLSGYILIRSLISYLSQSGGDGYDLMSMLSITATWSIVFLTTVGAKNIARDWNGIIFISGVLLVITAIVYQTRIVLYATNYTYVYGAIVINSVYYLAFLLPFIFISKINMLRILATILTISTVIISDKSTTLIALMIALIIPIIGEGSVNKRTIRTIVLMFLSAIAIFIFKDKLEMIDGFQKISNMSETGATGRFVIYGSIINKFVKSGIIQIIFGHGYGSVANTIGVSAHSDFLGILFEYGLVGAIMYVILIISLVKNAWRGLKSQNPLAIPFAMSVVIFFVVGLTSELVFIPRYFLFFPFLWGIFYKSLQNNEKQTFNQHRRLAK